MKVTKKKHSVTHQLRRHLIKIQRHTAEWLSLKINAMRPSHRKVFLLIVGIAMGLTCLNLVLHPFTSRRIEFSFPVDSIQRPLSVHRNGHIQKDNQSDGGLWATVSLLDSLRQTPFGKFWYDSINHARPGLEDSIRALIQSIGKQ